MKGVAVATVLVVILITYALFKIEPFQLGKGNLNLIPMVRC